MNSKKFYGNIRNFSIIAHIDHGKSTFSDRLIQICNGFFNKKIKDRILDSMELEQEKGITIKAQSVSLNYFHKNGKKYCLNFIDTPGHIDFRHEVYRSLVACEGAVLLIDASKGIEAQTITNYRTAKKMGKKIILVLNKIDLPNILENVEKIKTEISETVGVNLKEILECSAKTGNGIVNIINEIIKKIPSPSGEKSPLQALIIDSYFDRYLGIVLLIRIKNGILKKGEKIIIMSTGYSYKVDKIGIFAPKKITCESLKFGEIGWIACSIKDIHGAPVGDTITHFQNPAKTALLRFKKEVPKIYASLFPEETRNFNSLKTAIEKLGLNDSSLYYQTETIKDLGFGFRCGFLGLLHLEIVQKRIERENGIKLIVTSPTVLYRIHTRQGLIKYIRDPSDFDFRDIHEIYEPIAKCYILIPKENLGKVISLCIERRGIQKDIHHNKTRIVLIFDIPLVEIISDFSDRLQSISKGYASFEYKFKYFKKSDIVRIDFSVNQERIDMLSMMIHRKNSYKMSKDLVKKILAIIPRRQINIRVQASIEDRIVSRGTIKQFRKNVEGKCYGGDINRKKKLIEKQKIGKKKMGRISQLRFSKKIFFPILLEKYRRL